MEPPSIDEDARRKFEAAWAARKPIPIEDCLPPHDSPAWLPTVEELAHIELELGWKASRKNGPIVEDYLARFPQLLRADILLRLIQEEHDVRQRYGDQPSRQEYVKRFPDVILTGDELRPTNTLPLASVPVSTHLETRVSSDGGQAGGAAPEVENGGRQAGGHAVVTPLSHQIEGRSRYTLTRLHAEGGLGRVWIARDADLNRDVALKELKPSPASHPEASRRFVKEAQVTGQLEHPNIVPVYELGHRPEDNQPYYTMRFVHGQTLRDAVADYHRRRRSGHDDPVEWLRLLQAFVSICNAVSYAHSRGVIHRDLKPDNVLLGAFGEVLVLDWGLAKTSDTKDEHLTPIDVSETAASTRRSAAASSARPLTWLPNKPKGRIELVDERTDVYGLGQSSSRSSPAGRPISTAIRPTSSAKSFAIRRRCRGPSIQPRRGRWTPFARPRWPRSEAVGIRRPTSWPATCSVIWPTSRSRSIESRSRAGRTIRPPSSHESSICGGRRAGGADQRRDRSLLLDSKPRAGVSRY